jgi:hypothetical protein
MPSQGDRFFLEDHPSMDDDCQLPSGLGIVLAACVALLPLLTARLDVSPTLIVWPVGAVTILPVWRHAGEPLSTPVAAIPLPSLVIGPIVLALLFSPGASVAYIGAWSCTLGVMRFVTGWRDRT